MSILLDFIAEHYAEPLTLDALAEQVNEKAGHVSYLFYKYKKTSAPSITSSIIVSE